MYGVAPRVNDGFTQAANIAPVEHFAVAANGLQVLVGLQPGVGPAGLFGMGIRASCADSLLPGAGHPL